MTTKEQLDSAYRALNAIDILMSQDSVQDLEYQCMTDEPEFSVSSAREVNELLVKVYAIAHSEVPTHICYGVHQDWRNIKEEVLAQEPSE